jgi:FMN-dependent NADH-azoreductase
MNILHVDSSALGTHSVTRELGRAIVDATLRQHPRADVVYHDLAAEALPHWAPSADASDPAARAGSALLDEFLAADLVVIGAPMYNFSIPSTLKAWIDRIAVAGKTFRYGANGHEGLVHGKRVVIVSARGGIYSEGPAAAMDFQEDYLRTVFGFLGVKDIDVVRAEGVNLSPDAKQRALATAHASIASHERIAA